MVAQHQHGVSTPMPTNLWQRGVSGNPAGRTPGSRNRLSEAVICALLRDFSKHGEKAVAKVRRTHPAAYLKICALLVPRENKVEHSGGVKAMSDEQIERSIELIKEMLAQREAGAAAKVIEGTAEPAALPAPNGPSPEAALEATLEPTKRKPNRLMEADTAVGPKERKPRQRKMPPPASA
jgi:hypothetical protein